MVGFLSQSFQPESVRFLNETIRDWVDVLNEVRFQFGSGKTYPPLLMLLKASTLMHYRGLCAD